MKQTRALTEGAILLAIFILLLLVSLYIPVFGIIFSIFLPVPFILYTMRHDVRNAALVFACSLLLSFIIGSFVALGFAFLFGPSGIVIGELWKNRKSRYFTFLLGTITYLISIVALYAASILFFHVNMIQEMEQMMNESLKTVSETMSSLGQAQNEKAIERLQQMVDLIPYVMPTTFLFSAAFLSFLTTLTAAPIVKRLGYQIEPWPPFRLLVFPKSLLWYYLIVLILSMLPLEQGSYLFTAVLNISIVLQWCFIIQGLSFIYFYAHEKGWTKSIPIALTICIFILPFLLNIVRILGIIDLGFDLRKRLKIT
jgi:uncharacterized protein YybS (DUF2232 family)